MWRIESPTSEGNSSDLVEMNYRSLDYNPADDNEMVKACLLQLEAFKLSGYSRAKAFTILRFCVDYGMTKTVELAQLSALLAMKIENDMTVYITDITFPTTTLENYKKLEREMVTVYLFMNDTEPKSYADEIYEIYVDLDESKSKMLNQAVEFCATMCYTRPKTNVKKLVMALYYKFLLQPKGVDEEKPETVAIDPVSISNLKLPPPC